MSLKIYAERETFSGGVNKDNILYLDAKDNYGHPARVYYHAPFLKKDKAFEMLADYASGRATLPDYRTEGYEKEIDNWTDDINEVYERCNDIPAKVELRPYQQMYISDVTEIETGAIEIERGWPLLVTAYPHFEIDGLVDCGDGCMDVADSLREADAWGIFGKLRSGGREEVAEFTDVKIALFHFDVLSAARTALNAIHAARLSTDGLRLELFNENGDGDIAIVDQIIDKLDNANKMIVSSWGNAPEAVALMKEAVKLHHEMYGLLSPYGRSLSHKSSRLIGEAASSTALLAKAQQGNDTSLLSIAAAAETLDDSERAAELEQLKNHSVNCTLN